jgi:pteridine reductase
MPEPAKRPVAVITGAARRLGAAMTLALARAGYDVVVHHRSSAAEAEATAAAARQLGTRAVVASGDMTRRSDVAELLDVALGAFGHVDAVVANAGVFQRTPLATLTDTQWDAMLDGNLRSTFLCAQIFGLHMRQQGSGVLIALADVAALRPWSEYLPYNVSKAGIVALVQTLAKELAPQVRVNAVAPGPVLFPPGYDPQARKREVDRTLLRREGRAENVAQAVLSLIQNDYLTGVVLPVDGGRLLR